MVCQESTAVVVGVGRRVGVRMFSDQSVEGPHPILPSATWWKVDGKINHLGNWAIFVGVEAFELKGQGENGAVGAFFLCIL